MTPGYGRTTTLQQDRWGNAFGETSGAQIRSYLWATPVVCRLETISDAWNLARRRALQRLTEEATEVGADAVVGVSLRRGDHDLGRRTVEYAVNGTAVRVRDAAGARRAGADRPVGPGLRQAAAGRSGAGRPGGDDRRGVRVAVT